MCGFVQLINDIASPSAIDICRLIAHRGPDSEGHRTIIGQGWRVLQHFRRLAIIDLDARSNQPFGDHRGSLLYNGELYNTSHLRETLTTRGVKFRTTSDTEVLYELLLQRDARDLLDGVDGMFAFVLQLPTGVVHYGRDRLGIKPLYEARDDGGRLVALASEIEPLRMLGLAGSIDPIAVAQATLFLWTPPPRTGWTRCHTVPPGTSWIAEAPTFMASNIHWQSRTPTEDRTILEAVRESIARQLKADVPVGLFFSGGLDSTWLAIELTRAGFSGPFVTARAKQSPQSAEPFAPDAPHAAQVATRLGIKLTWLDLDENFLCDLPRVVGVMEHPFADPAAITLMQLSEAARAHAKVMLSGVGVEELFLGYERQQAIRALQTIPSSARELIAARVPMRWIPQRLRERATKFARLASSPPLDWPWVSQAYYSIEEWGRLSPNVTLDEAVAEHRKMAGAALSDGKSPLAAAAAVDRTLFLPGLNLHYADRSSMSASVELRVPFLGDPVVGAALRHSPEWHLRPGKGKRRFREAAGSAGVPEHVLRRSKTGLGGPVRTLLREQGDQLWRVASSNGLFQDLLDGHHARNVILSHVHGKSESGLAAFGLIALATWWERYVDGQGPIHEFLEAGKS